MAESWKKLKTSSVFSSFIVCQNRNRSAPVRELLSNNSLFVGQLYEDKSLALHARDLIFFTTDLQTVNYYQQFTAGADLFLKDNQLVDSFYDLKENYMYHMIIFM